MLDEGNEVVVLFSAGILKPCDRDSATAGSTRRQGQEEVRTAEQLRVIDFRLSTRRLGAGQRTDGVVIFERPNFKQSSETLFLQVADSGAVDLPALAPIGFGMSSFRGGSAYEAR